MSDSIELKPCPFCGAKVTICAGHGAHAGQYGFCHPGGRDGFDLSPRCIVRTNIVFVNFREASEWAAAWNRRAGE